MTAKRTDLDQFAELLAAVVRSVSRDITPERARFWIENQETLGVVIRAALGMKPQQAKEEQGAATPTKSQWQEMFGHLRVWDRNFNESNYPLGEDPGDEAEEFVFGEFVTGHTALCEFGRVKRQGASLWAQGRYIKAHPEAQKEHSLLGVGALWQSGEGDVYYPIYYWLSGELRVRLTSLNDEVSPTRRFLRRKEAGI